MKKVLVVLFMLVVSIGFTSCEPESIADTDNIYAGDKDEEPDRDSIYASDKDEEPDRG